ncbi:hypothetical protein Q2T42_05905 [Leptolyngbya boryana CZ1]|uniref:Uncharacterized protein n=1 Tax=Leptolyngbya boryana CZ1 TaxID=3060204 RepID=A0AA96WXH0_LEPBY|nr:hypothetical protein [Leptolyngbya boryana]WNZ47367.1 hypothetical protein Q2T42_05905 [Leptolyngbya boryana CZ1]
MQFKGIKQGKVIRLTTDAAIEDNNEVTLQVVKGNRWSSLRLRRVLSIIITSIGIFYLLLSLMGNIKKDDRLGQSEIIIFATILLLNSELIERLAKLQLGKDGMTLELKEKVETVQKKQDEQQEEIESIVAFLVKRSMNDGDYEVLKELASELSFAFDKAQEKSRQVQKAFLCLRDLGLIEKAGGELLKKEDIEELPSPSPNLKNHISITRRGRQCLVLIERYSQNNQPTPLNSSSGKQV